MANAGGTTSSPKIRYFALFVLVRMKGVFICPFPSPCVDTKHNRTNKSVDGTSNGWENMQRAGGCCEARMFAAVNKNPEAASRNHLESHLREQNRVRVDLSRFAPVSGRVSTVPVGPSRLHSMQASNLMEMGVYSRAIPCGCPEVGSDGSSYTEAAHCEMAANVGGTTRASDALRPDEDEGRFCLLC
jgi:hypothetical protein